MSIRRFYSVLLHLYPRDYAACFAEEMANVFENACADRRRQGWTAFARFAMGELAGLVIRAGTEWIARLTTDRSVRGRGLPDLRNMRPVGISREFWFAAAGSDLDKGSLPTEVAQAQERVAGLVGRIVFAIAHHDFPAARSYSFEEQRERDNLRALRKKYALDE